MHNDSLCGMDEIVHITYIIRVLLSSAKVCSTFVGFVIVEKGSALHLIDKGLIPGGELCSLSSFCLSLS